MMIPPDAGVRLRLQGDSVQPQPAAPVSEIPSDLPELRAGQTFVARIQEALPENTFKALVAGRQLTLQLPEGAKQGDVLELVVIDRTPKVVIARLAEAPAASGTEEPYPYATLSRTGRMIGNLLLAEGETPKPALLNRGEPLMQKMPASAAELAPTLQKAITQSGLFYESHQMQWIGGRLPVEQLLQEPQGRRSTLEPRHGGEERPPASQDALVRLSSAASSPAAEARGEERGNALSPAPATAPHLAAVPDELRPIVQQQLDAVATQRLIWHGEAWPNQPLEWEIVREDEHRPAAAEADDAVWRTTLRLDTPRLGHVDASLRLTSAGIYMTLTATDAVSAANLQGQVPALAASLEAAGITPLSMLVRHEAE